MTRFPKISLSGENAKMIEKAYITATEVLKRCEIEHKIFDKVLKAGGCYCDVWTRDASYNAWMAYNLVNTDIAYNTLQVPLYFGKGKFISGKTDEGCRDQYWDKMLWTVAAFDYYTKTQDKEFLKTIYDASASTIDEIYDNYFCEEFGLQYGPAFMCDGIGALPNDICNEQDCPLGKSEAITYEKANKIMTLSSNCILFAAINITVKIAQILKMDVPAQLVLRASNLKNNINKWLWNEELGRYDYFLYGYGQKKGKRANFQEGAGLAFAILFDVADQNKTEKIMQNVHLEPSGIPLNWPSFDNHYIGGARFRGDATGHDTPQNVTIWPNINGLWAKACAYKNHNKNFEYEILSLAKLICNSDNTVYEIYNAKTGEAGLRFYEKKHDQAWAAAAFLDMIYSGLFGVRVSVTGEVEFKPQSIDGITNGSIENIVINNKVYNYTF